MAILLPPSLDLGLYYQKSKTQRVKKKHDLLQIAAETMYV